MDTLFWQVIESPKLSIAKKVDREFFIFLFLSIYFFKMNRIIKKINQKWLIFLFTLNVNEDS